MKLNIVTIICLVIFILFIEFAILAIIFSSKNKLATKITKYLMKTQKIRYPLTIEEVDERIVKLSEKELK